MNPQNPNQTGKGPQQQGSPRPQDQNQNRQGGNVGGTQQEKEAAERLNKLSQNVGSTNPTTPRSASGSSSSAGQTPPSQFGHKP